jgi:protein CWC15
VRTSFQFEPNLVLYSFFRQVGQTSTVEVQKRDLRADLLAAEQEARNKKRKAEGKPLEAVEEKLAIVDDETNKRRKMLQDAIDMDKDDDDEDESDEKKEEEAKEQGTDEDEDRSVLSHVTLSSC